MNLEVHDSPVLVQMDDTEYATIGSLCFGGTHRKSHAARHCHITRGQDNGEPYPRGWYAEHARLGLELPTYDGTLSLGGSFHVVDYNSTTGAVIRQRTSQGYADNRCAPLLFPCQA